MCADLLAFPAGTPSDGQEPDIALPAGIVKLHASMLETLYGVDVSDLDPITTLLCGLVVSRWRAIISLGAIRHLPYVNWLRRPGRRELVDAIRAVDGEAILAAYRECREDGIPEVAEEWNQLCRHNVAP